MGTGAPVAVADGDAELDAVADPRRELDGEDELLADAVHTVLCLQRFQV